MYFLPCLCLEQVLSGDAAVILGPPRGGPPPTRTVALSNILAPRLARRGNPNVEGSSDTVDEVNRHCNVYLFVACVKTVLYIAVRMGSKGVSPQNAGW